MCDEGGPFLTLRPTGKVWGHCPADAPRLLCSYSDVRKLEPSQGWDKTLSKDLFRPVLAKLEGSIFLVTAVVQLSL